MRGLKNKEEVRYTISSYVNGTTCKNTLCRGRAVLHPDGCYFVNDHIPNMAVPGEYVLSWFLGDTHLASETITIKNQGPKYMPVGKTQFKAGQTLGRGDLSLFVVGNSGPGLTPIVTYSIADVKTGIFVGVKNRVPSHHGMGGEYYAELAIPPGTASSGEYMIQWEVNGIPLTHQYFSVVCEKDTQNPDPKNTDNSIQEAVKRVVLQTIRGVQEASEESRTQLSIEDLNVSMDIGTNISPNSYSVGGTSVEFESKEELISFSVNFTLRNDP
jgi:hypothetical protein